VQLEKPSLEVTLTL